MLIGRVHPERDGEGGEGTSRPRSGDSARLAGILAASLLAGACFDEPGAVGEAGGDLSEVAFDLKVVDTFRDPPDGGFWEPSGIAVAADRVFVLDHKADRIFEHDLEGRHRRSFAREGSGPGELNGALAIGVLPDTLWVLNAGNRRIDYFGLDGSSLGTRRLPDEAGAVVDMISLGEEFVATVLFGEAPLIRFPRTAGSGRSGSARAFGGELARREAGLREALSTGDASSGAQAVPSVYRLARVGDRFWAMHLYLPLVGIFGPDGALVRTVTYPSEPVRPGRQKLGEVDGRSVRIREAPPEPAGAIGLVPGAAGRVYLLTHQEQDGAQRLYLLTSEGEVLSRSINPVEGVFAFSASSGDRRFVVGTEGALEKPTVFALEPSRRGSEGDPRESGT